jgi:hemoglobin
MKNTEQTLFDKYGGVEVVGSLVRTFYERVLLDPLLSPYFVDINMPALVDHQVAFMRFAMGKSSESFTPDRMAEAHQKFRIDQAAFDRAVQILTDVLKEGGVEHDDLLLIVQRIAIFAADIIFQEISP